MCDERASSANTLQSAMPAPLATRLHEQTMTVCLTACQECETGRINKEEAAERIYDVVYGDDSEIVSALDRHQTFTTYFEMLSSYEKAAKEAEARGRTQVPCAEGPLVGPEAGGPEPISEDNTLAGRKRDRDVDGLDASDGPGK
jgi:hypothetical protein